MRIVVTNDDGIDSKGLHALAMAMTRHGDVTVIAPDGEHSGASSAFGALHLIQPVAYRVDIGGVPEAYSVSGPPALCIMFARLGAFGPPPDLVVSGINPGANVGRSVYHSGTVGACLTARNGNIAGVAVSQAVTGWGVEGQGWEEMVANQNWDTAARVADSVVEGLLADFPDHPAVINVNVPDCALEEIKGWKVSKIGTAPPRTMAKAWLEDRPGHERSWNVHMDWGDVHEPHEESDVSAVMDGYVAVSWLTQLAHDSTVDPGKVGSALDGLLAR